MGLLLYLSVRRLLFTLFWDYYVLIYISSIVRVLNSSLDRAQMYSGTNWPVRKEIIFHYFVPLLEKNTQKKDYKHIIPKYDVLYRKILNFWFNKRQIFCNKLLIQRPHFFHTISFLFQFISFPKMNELSLNSWRGYLFIKRKSLLQSEATWPAFLLHILYEINFMTLLRNRDFLFLTS